MSTHKIVVSKNGPYVVAGGLPLSKEIAEIGKDGQPDRWVKGAQYPLQEVYELCRCGRSKNKPFCDGTHASSAGDPGSGGNMRVAFDGTETAERVSYEELAQRLEGPGIDVLDARPLCSGARFCEPEGSVWNLVPKSGDPAAKEAAIREACNCPSGRLVAYDKTTGEPIEPAFTPAISLIEDPQACCSGPIWVKGGVAIESADGRRYETRNRVTLCRCGVSGRKPLCDASHIGAQFNDGDESLR